MIYDSQFFQHLATLNESKGCHLFAVNEKAYSLAVVTKKKVSIYLWQPPNFHLRKEFSLSDTPKSIYYVNNCLIVGYKKFYECIDINSGIVSRILDVEKDHKMIMTEVGHFLVSLFYFQLAFRFCLPCPSLPFLPSH
jgi:hypothetical protein